MKSTAASARAWFQPPPVFPELKPLFRKEFQRALRICVFRGFTVEESFGMIWEETLEAFPLPEPAQADIYAEMIKWAKNARL